MNNPRNSRKLYGAISHPPRKDEGWFEGKNERALAAAVMGTAIDDYMGYGSRTHGGKKEAQEWLFSDLMAPMSFCWCCLALELEPEEIRAKLHSGDCGNYVATTLPRYTGNE